MNDLPEGGQSEESLISSLLACSGFLDPENGCLERVSCEYASRVSRLPEKDKNVIAMYGISGFILPLNLFRGGIITPQKGLASLFEVRGLLETSGGVSAGNDVPCPSEQWKLQYLQSRSNYIRVFSKRKHGRKLKFLNFNLHSLRPPQLHKLSSTQNSGQDQRWCL